MKLMKLKRQKKERLLTFAVSENEKKRIEQEAIAADLSVSEYIRACIKRQREATATEAK